MGWLILIFLSTAEKDIEWKFEKLMNTSSFKPTLVKSYSKSTRKTKVIPFQIEEFKFKKDLGNHLLQSSTNLKTMMNWYSKKDSRRVRRSNGRSNKRILKISLRMNVPTEFDLEIREQSALLDVVSRLFLI